MRSISSMDIDRDSGQTIPHHPQWPNIPGGPSGSMPPVGPPHGARPVPHPPGLHPPQPPQSAGSSTTSSSTVPPMRQNGSAPPGIMTSDAGAVSPTIPHTTPTLPTYPSGATVSYTREDGRVGTDGQAWPAPRVGADQPVGPISTLLMPEFWCSIGYFELDTQVVNLSFNTNDSKKIIYMDRLARYLRYRVPGALLLLMAMWTQVEATGFAWEP